MFKLENLFSERIGGKTFGQDKRIYKFEEIKKAKDEVLKRNKKEDLLDFGIGEPLESPEAIIQETLKEELKITKNHLYADNGIEEFKQSIADHMQKHFALKLDPETEVSHCIGIKSALSYIPKIFIDKDDYALIPRPSYPIMQTHVQWLGGKIFFLDLNKKNHFLPKLDNIPSDIRRKSKLIYINYPNNPTGAIANRSFYEELVAFAMENEIVIIQDAAYMDLYYDDEPLSLLKIKGAKSISLELYSFSKAYNMTGWRLGFLVGSSLLIKAFLKIKSNMDSGQFIPIQKAGIKALENYGIAQKNAQKYKRRISILSKILKEKNFFIPEIKAGFFLYTFAPKAIKNGPAFESAKDFSQFLIQEKLIVLVPWDEVENDRGIRFSVTFSADENEEIKIFKALKNRLEDLEFIF